MSKSDTENKEKILDYVYWIRQAAALVLGVIWGILGIKGFLGIATFIALNSLLVYLYIAKNHSKETDIYGDSLKEGFMNAFSVFMVSWTISYSATFF